MEEFGGPCFEGIGNTIRKKRSQTSRRPRPDSVLFPEKCDHSPLSSTPSSDDMGKVSSDDNAGNDTKSRRKEFNLNQCALRGSHKSNEDGLSSFLYGNGSLGGPIDEGGNGLNHRRHSEGMLAPANWKNKAKGNFELQPGTTDIYGGINGESLGHSRVNGDRVGNDKKVKKVKLKVGGVTRTIQAKSNPHGPSGSGSSTKSSRAFDAHRSRHKLILQDDSENDNSPSEKKSGVHVTSWKDLSRVSASRAKEDIAMGRKAAKNASATQAEKLEAVRKSKRVPKRRLLDGAFDEEDEDDEIRYLEKLKNSKATAGSKDFEEESSKKQRISRVSRNATNDEISEDLPLSRSTKDNKKKSLSERGSEDTDFEEEEEELISDGEAEGKKKKKPRNDALDSSSIETKPALTTRQRALLSSKDASSGASAIEFPNGLPPAPPRKQKEKLSEVEQQLKKAEAAQRRRMQVEKAARESEAEAIRKILGQDSSRKKREDKMKKRQEELAQEKAANALKLASNTVRYVMGPTGTTVTFPNELGLPSIFDFKQCSYPPPREKCAGPSCTNLYKYRDSKSKLPLCSLKCYKAIHEKMHNEVTS
ncbi:hypothetical protein NMG60_11035114 [Bertholletia excelsa]